MGNHLSRKYKRKGGYVQKYEEWLASPAYRDLKPIARCLLEEFQRLFRPDRNGQLSISVANACKLVKASKESVSKAFYELADHGFLKPMKDAFWMERIPYPSLRYTSPCMANVATTNLTLNLGSRACVSVVTVFLM